MNPPEKPYWQLARIIDDSRAIYPEIKGRTIWIVCERPAEDQIFEDDQGEIRIATEPVCFSHLRDFEKDSREIFPLAVLELLPVFALQSEVSPEPLSSWLSRREDDLNLSSQVKREREV